MARYKFEQIAINSTEKKKPVEEDRFTYVGLEHLDPGSLNVTRFGSETAPVGEKLVMHKGDVLFGKRRAYQKKVAIAPFDGIFSAHGMVLRPKEDIVDKNFFPLFISSDYFLDEAIRISVGSLSPTINWRDLKELEFELPDLEEQRKLAEVLWAINDAMEAYKKLISATEELVKSRFIEMFGDPEAETCTYCTCKLRELSNKISDGVHAKPKYLDSGRPFLSVVNINKKKIDFTDCKYVSEEAYQKMIKSTYPEKGDVLYTKVGTYGIPAYVDTDEEFCLYVSVCLIKPKHDLINSKFLALQMDMPFIRHQADSRIKGIGVPDLHLNQIAEFDIINPPRYLQDDFVAFAEQTDKSKYELEQALLELTATYKRIVAENLG